MNTLLSTREVSRKQAAHRARAELWTRPRRARSSVGEREPVLDFLFEYYPYSPSKLEQWFPGWGFDLDASAEFSGQPSAFIRTSHSLSISDTYLEKNRRRIEFVIELLTGIESRGANFHCFGVHEWAMVYRMPADTVRHPDPLRLTSDEIAQTVETVGLRCTHIDAFRFFTPEAVPLNANEAGLTPTRENQTQLDQRGCLHATMDLYKYCMWLQPLVPGDLVLDCFELAVETRTLDMQASPYDLSAFGYRAVPIETPEGRREYAHLQKEISRRAEPLRQRLLSFLLNALNGIPRSGQAFKHQVPVQIR